MSKSRHTPPGNVNVPVKEHGVKYIAPPRSAGWHGTITGYTNHRCRCDDCCEANTAWVKSYRARRQAGKPSTARPGPTI